MINPKLFALVGAGLVDGALLLLQGTSTTPGEIVVGAGAGGTISVAVWWVYKNTVDNHTETLKSHAAKIEELQKQKLEKDDLESLHNAIARIEVSLENITRALMSKGGS